MKKKIFIIASILIYASLAIYGTYAFNTVEEVTHNIITTSGVAITVEEWQLVDGNRVPYPEEPITIMPGLTVSKIFTVRNLDEDAYLRCHYDCKIFDPDGNEIVLTPAELWTVVSITPNTEAWTYLDGRYYYNKALVKNEVTEPLFTEVTFPEESLDNRFQGAKLIITVYASAVQAKNNGDIPTAAAGWAE